MYSTKAWYTNCRYLYGVLSGFLCRLRVFYVLLYSFYFPNMALINSMNCLDMSTIWNRVSLRAVVSNYRESAASCKNSNFFFFRQKIPLDKLFSKTIFKRSSETLVWRKIEKFEIWVNLAKKRLKIMRIRAFSKRSYKTAETCLYLKCTGFVTHPLKLL